MPTEIIGKLTELNIKHLYCTGSILVKTEGVINYAEPEMKTFYIEVPFIVNDTEAINIIRKSDRELKLSGRFNNNADELVFCVLKAEEI